MTAPDDRTTHECLIRATLDGDDEAFAELVRQTKGRVFGIAARFARNHHELDDICQNIFIRVYKNLSKFRGDAPFEHWISRIAVRTCYDALRKRRREPEKISMDHHFVDKDAENKTNRSVEEAAELLRFAMAKLPAEDQFVITLLELEEKSVREIAGLTGWSEGNVKVRAFRARNSLKKILETHHE